MWGTKQINTFHLKRTASYAEAVEYFEGNTWAKRGDPTTKWLHKDRSQHMTMGADKTVGFYLHGSRYVTFYPDNSMKINWCRPKENALLFINQLTPNDITFEAYGTYSRNIVGIRDWGRNSVDCCYWQVGDEPVFQRAAGAWAILTPTTPFVVPRLDRKAATAALKRAGAGDFAAWATATARLGGWLRHNPAETIMWFNPNANDYHTEVVKCLGNPDQWYDLLISPSLTNYAKDGLTAAKRAIHAVRKSVYATTPGVITWTEQPCLDDRIMGLPSYVNAVKEYSYARST